MRKFLSIVAMFIISLLAVSLVAAVPATSTLGSITAADVTVEINDEEYDTTNLLVVEEGETLDIEVELRNNGAVDAKSIEVSARLSGYEYSTLEDSTSLFDVKAGTRKKVSLELTIPNDLTNGENTLRVFVFDRNGAPIQFDYEVEVESPRNSVDIEDVTFSPGNTVRAGRSLLANVLVENYGDRTEEDVKVTVAIPALGISATDFIDEIDADESEYAWDFADDGLLLSIPANAPEGDYAVEVTVEYDNLHDSTTRTYTIHVLGNDHFGDVSKLVLAVGPESQNVAAGSTASYGIALTNAGSASRAYTISAVTGDWATASLSETLVVLESGKNAVVYVDLAVARNAPAGAHMASVSVMSGSETLETVALSANVVEAGSSRDSVDLRNGLEIALIVLVVLLVIIGLIVGFSRLRRDDDDDQTYY